jgi:beta-barrel assembly-enhancing protease
MWAWPAALKWVNSGLDVMAYDNNMALRKTWQRGGAVVLMLALALPPPATAQNNLNLPKLGEASGDELSLAAERRVGEAIMRDLRRERVVLEDQELNDYLNRFAARLTSVPSANGFSFDFFFVPDSSLNAFALPGGFIGVHTGLMAAAQSESEVASVLAHEIGHVTQRHIARMLTAQRQSSVWQIASLVLAALAARSNPQAALGAISLGMGAQQDALLSFSRDAEREADRVGLSILGEAGFDASGMVAFFTRLQQATRIYESTAPAYMRSHPLTVERIADMQSRLRQERYRQHPDSLDFRLAQAKVRALADVSVDGLRSARAGLERRLREGASQDTLATWYGITVVALQQRDVAAAQRAYAELNRLVNNLTAQAGHPFVDRLNIDVRQLAGGASAARQASAAALVRWPNSSAIVYRHAQALLDDQQIEPAVKLLEDRVQTVRTEALAWRLLARAKNQQGQAGAAHRASAEEYALFGGWLAAIEQLQLARRATDLDFFAVSQVDARLREIQAIYQQEQSERGPRR